MMNRKDHLLRIIAVLVITLLAHEGSEAAEPDFVINDPLRFSMPLSTSDSIQLSFLIFSKEGTISGIDLQVGDAKGPDGQALNTDALNITKKPQQVTPLGGQVIFTLKPDRFIQTGEYQVTLLIQGKTPSGADLGKLATVIINRTPAELDLESAKDQVIELKRGFPGAAASKTFRIYLTETSRKANIENLEAFGQNIYVKGTKMLAPGNVTVKLVKDDSASSSQGAAGGQQALDITLSGLTDAGSFATQLTLNSPSFNSAKVISLNINVTDSWFFPLLVILLGVIGGFIANYLSQQYKPRQLNRYSIIRLRDLLNRQRQLVNKPGKQEELQQIMNKIEAAEGKNSDEDYTGAKAQLTEAETALLEFYKKENKEKSETYTGLISLRTQVEVFPQKKADLTETERDSLQTILDKVSDAESLLADDQVDRATALLTTAKAVMDGLKRQIINKELDRLSKQLAKVSETMAEDREQIKTEIDSVRASLETADPDESLVKVRSLAAKLASLLESSQGLGARPLGHGRAVESIELPTGAESARDRMSIKIFDPPKNRTTQANIVFTVEDPKQEIEEGARLKWDFGERGPLVEGGKSIHHRFQQPGSYLVKVLIMAAENEDRINGQLSHPITILPGPTELTLQGIKQGVRSSEWLLTSVAIILAAVTGLLALYVGKTFGTVSDYLLALLWGFGIDNAVRGFAGVIKKITTG